MCCFDHGSMRACEDLVGVLAGEGFCYQCYCCNGADAGAGYLVLHVFCAVREDCMLHTSSAATPQVLPP